MVVVIRGVVFDVEHDAEDADENKILQEQEHRQAIRLVGEAMFKIVIVYRVNGDEACPGKADHERLEPSLFPEVIVAEQATVDAVIQNRRYRE